jgi:D-xylose transport system substrate-binding protein
MRWRLWAAGLLALAACKQPAAEKKIALLLPESKTARYETQDWPAFRDRLVALGMRPQDILYSNANQDVGQQRQQAEAALTNGAVVLVLDPVDSVAAAGIVELAHARGVAVIAYDRLIRDTAHLSAYISFDNERVGQLQGEALLGMLGDKVQPAVVFIHGSPTDNNASLFKKGARAALLGKVAVAGEYDTPDWSPDKARDQMQQALTARGNKVDGVYAANDGTAGGAIAALKAAGVTPLPPVTGQDAELAAIQRILLGEQSLTIYKAIRPEAQLAAELAFALRNTQGPLTHAALTSRTHNGAAAVPSALLTPVVVTRANVKDTVVKDGFWKAADICTPELAEACKAAGIQ